MVLQSVEDIKKSTRFPWISQAGLGNGIYESSDQFIRRNVF